MGFLVSFSRKMYLTQYMHNLERRLNDKTTEKLKYTDQIAEYTTQINDISDSDSPAVKKLQAKKAELEKMKAEIQEKMKNDFGAPGGPREPRGHRGPGMHGPHHPMGPAPMEPAPNPAPAEAPEK